MSDKSLTNAEILAERVAWIAESQEKPTYKEEDIGCPRTNGNDERQLRAAAIVSSMGMRHPDYDGDVYNEHILGMSREDFELAVGIHG